MVSWLLVVDDIWLVDCDGLLVGVKDVVVDEDAWMPLVDEDTAAKP